MQGRLYFNKIILTFYERLSLLWESEGFRTANEFARKGLGYQRSETIRRLKEEKNQPSYAIIKDIAEAFTNWNIRWLITGAGEMKDKLKVIEDARGINLVAEEGADFKVYFPTEVKEDNKEPSAELEYLRRGMLEINEIKDIVVDLAEKVSHLSKSDKL